MAAPPTCAPPTLAPPSTSHPPSSSLPATKLPSNLGDMLVHAWDFIRFQLRLDESDSLDFQNSVWSSLRSRVSPAARDRSSARLLLVCFQPSSLYLDAPLVAMLLQFRLGGVAAEFAVELVSDHVFSFLVACSKVAKLALSCSPINNDHYSAFITAPPSPDGDRSSSYLLQRASTPGYAPSRSSSATVGPLVVSSLLPPRSMGAVGGESSKALDSGAPPHRHLSAGIIRPQRLGRSVPELR